MGLSSSQARFLSFTARMHDIEYKAQKLDAQKLQMANQSAHVYSEYQDALNSTKITTSIMNSNGSVSNVPLTADLIYNYGNLPNRYVLTTIDGKILIPESLHENYQKTNSLAGFLGEYDFATTTSEIVPVQKANPEYVQKQQEYENDLVIWQKAQESAEPIYDTTLADNFMIAAKSTFANGATNCYNEAINGHITCYSHILAHMIDYDGNTASKQEYQTSIDGTIKDLKISGYSDNKTSKPIFKEISKFVSDTNNLVVVTEPFNQSEYDSYTDYEKLQSKYDANGNAKTLKQWIIDLYYITVNTSNVNGYPKSENGLTGNQIFGKTIDNIQDVLAKSLTVEQGKPVLSDYVDGVEPTIMVDEVVEDVIFDNKEQAQWYIELWSKMNGESAVPQIINGNTVDNISNNTTIYGINQYTGTPETKDYVVIPQDKMNDNQWLTNAINSGFIMIQELNKKKNIFEDTSVATNTSLKELSDEVELKKAEAKYEADMRKINAKDKKYDTDLARLEQERNAIKTEMETLKTVMKDNVERTFKLFS